MNRLLPASFFRWCVATPIGSYFHTSLWGFAILETFHILGLTLLLGTIFVVNLSVLGLGLRQSVDRIARELAPWTVAGLLLMIGSGVPMFMSSAIQYGSSFPFLIKMMLLLSAIALQVAIYRKATKPGVTEGSRVGRLAACLALICWFGVAYAGRAISFEILFGA
jgi:hypothetical protein